MRPTAVRTDDRPAEGIAQADMSAEEIAAVAQVMADHMQPRRGPDGDDYFAPILPGTVRASRGGALWVSWNPTAIYSRWYRLMDVPSMPAEGYVGARIVWDSDGRPLGNAEGPLMLTVTHHVPTAIIVNTGFSYVHEIVWPEVAADA